MRAFSRLISATCSWLCFLSTVMPLTPRSSKRRYSSSSRMHGNSSPPPPPPKVGSSSRMPGSSSPLPPPPKVRRQGRRRRSTSPQQQQQCRMEDQSQLSAEQRQVLDAVARGESVFVTGSGGTGKTFLLRHIIALLRHAHSPGSVFVTASTGVAACALDGQTLHSFAGIGLGAGDAQALFFKAAGNRLATRRWCRARALVIDEVSMIDGELFDTLDLIARKMRPDSAAQPWGGIQLVVSGDFFQLPPIRAPNPAKEFAFEADCWHACFHRQVELTHVFRQSDPRLIHLLQGIRRGRRDDLHFLLQCCGTTTNTDSRAPEEVGEEVVVTWLFPRNEDVRRVNNERLRSLGRDVITYRAIDSGAKPWRSQLKQGIAPEELELCHGARVMLIKNTDLKAGLVNGTTGVVTGFVEQQQAEGGKVSSSVMCDSIGLLPRVRFDTGLEMVVEAERWDVMDGETVQATRRQIPLILAWALSVHKCQGMTLQHLQTDLSRAFGCGMVYVALSRVKSLDGLHLSGFNPHKIKAHPKVVKFYSQLLDDQA